MPGFGHLRRNNKEEILATPQQKAFIQQLVEKFDRVFLVKYEQEINFKKLTKRDAAKLIEDLKEKLGDDLE